MSALLFCTTPLATLDVVREFCQVTRASYDARYPGFALWEEPFILARRDPQQTPGPRDEPIEQVVELFDGLSDSELQTLYLESYSKLNGEMPQGAFAVLDERGVREKTVVIHGWYPPFDDDEEDSWRAKLDTWHSWRVGFEAAEEAIRGVTGPLELFELIFLRRAHNFTGEDGVFDYQKTKDMAMAGNLSWYE